MPPIRLSTVGNRAFAVAGPCLERIAGGNDISLITDELSSVGLFNCFTVLTAKLFRFEIALLLWHFD